MTDVYLLGNAGPQRWTLGEPVSVSPAAAAGSASTDPADAPDPLTPERENPDEHRPAPPAARRSPAAGASWTRSRRPPMSTITIRHTYADGTMVEGGRRGDGVWEILKALHDNWKYRRTVGMFLGLSRDRPRRC